MINTRPRLVLIDDNPDDRALVIRELQREFPALQVEQPADATQLKQVLGAGDFDLVITDYRLHWTTGIVILHRVKGIRPNCPVIMFTSTGSEEIAVAAMKTGLDDYIIKAPQHYTKLAEAVRLALERMRQLKVLQDLHTQFRSLSKEDVSVQKAVVQEERKLIASLQIRVSQQNAIATFSQQALRGINVSALMDTAVTLIAETLEVEYVTVLERLPKGETLLLRAGFGWQEGVVGKAIVDTGINSQAGYTLLSKKPVIVENWRSEPRFSEPPLLCNHGVVSSMSVIIPGSSLARQGELRNGDNNQSSPITKHSTSPAFGVLGVYTTQRRTFTQDEINFLQAIANILAEAIARSDQEETLRKQAQLMDLVNDAVIVRDLDGIISYWNQAAQRFYGWTPEEAVGQNSHSLLQTEFPQALRQIQDRLLSQGYWQGELIHRKRDGTKVTVVSHWTLQPDDLGNPSTILEINDDITRAKQAEEAHRQSYAQLQHLVESNLIGVIFADGSGNITKSKDDFLEMVGYTREELRSGKVGWVDLTPPKYTEADTLSRAPIRVPGVCTPYEQEYISLVISMATCIAERKQMEATLRDREQKFRATVEQAAVGIAHVSVDGQWLFVNQALCDIVEYSRSELLKRTFQEITHPDDLDAELELFNQLWAGKIPAYSIEKRYTKSSGSSIWINLTMSLMREVRGEPKYSICVIEEISDRKQVEMAWQQSIIRLENLHEIDKAILAAHSPQATAEAALERLKQLLPCTQLSVLVFDFESRDATIVATHSDNQTQIKAGTQLSLELFSSVLAQLRQGEIYDQTKLESLPQSRPIVQAFQVEGSSSFRGFPLIAQQELIGTLKVWVNSPHPLTPEQIAIAQEVADRLALSVQQYRKQQQLVRYTTQLEQRVGEYTVEIQQLNAELERRGQPGQEPHPKGLRLEREI